MTHEVNWLTRTCPGCGFRLSGTSESDPEAQCLNTNCVDRRRARGLAPEVPALVAHNGNIVQAYIPESERRGPLPIIFKRSPACEPKLMEETPLPPAPLREDGTPFVVPIVYARRRTPNLPVTLERKCSACEHPLFSADGVEAFCPAESCERYMRAQ